MIGSISLSDMKQLNHKEEYYEQTIINTCLILFLK